jgi:IS5 family transposase
LLTFRHLLEDNQLFEQIFEAVNSLLVKNGLTMSKGTIVDATIIEAPSSTKNKDKARDNEMHSTKKGAQWHFGMKAHIGVDEETGLVHTVTTTAANAHDITEAHKLIRETYDVVRGDAGFVGLEKRDEIKELNKSRKDENKPQLQFEINLRPGKVKSLPSDDAVKLIEHAKSVIRAKVEHGFLFIKHIFGYRKTRYKGLAKNAHRLYLLFASANMIIADRIHAKLQTT